MRIALRTGLLLALWASPALANEPPPAPEALDANVAGDDARALRRAALRQIASEGDFEGPAACSRSFTSLRRAYESERAATTDAARARNLARLDRAGNELDACLARDAEARRAESVQPRSTEEMVAVSPASLAPTVAATTEGVPPNPFDEGVRSGGRSLRLLLQRELAYQPPTPEARTPRQRTDGDTALVAFDVALHAIAPGALASNGREHQANELQWLPVIEDDEDAAEARRQVAALTTGTPPPARAVLRSLREAASAAIESATHTNGHSYAARERTLEHVVATARLALAAGAPRDEILRALDDLVRRLEWGP